MIKQKKIKATKEVNSNLTTTQTAKLLNISRTSLYRNINERAIPFYKQKGVILFNPEEVIKWVESHRVSSIEETKVKTLNEFQDLTTKN